MIPMNQMGKCNRFLTHDCDISTIAVINARSPIPKGSLQLSRKIILVLALHILAQS